MIRPALILLLLSSAAHSQVVVGENVRLYSPALFAEYGLFISKLPAHDMSSPCYGAGCWTRAGFDYDNGWLRNIAITLDEGSDLYLVQAGDIFNASTAANLPRIIAPDFYVGSDFVLGIATSYLYATPRTAFGWVHLVAEGDSLRMIDNAMAYGSGIVIGTGSIPEPSTLVLCLSFLAQWPRRRRPIIRLKRATRPGIN